MINTSKDNPLPVVHGLYRLVTEQVKRFRTMDWYYRGSNKVNISNRI